MRCKVWGDSGGIVRYPLLISLAYSTCLPSCPYWRPCLVQSGRSERAMNSPAVATDAPDGLQLVCAGAPSAYLPEQVYSYLPDGHQLVRAQNSLATGTREAIHAAIPVRSVFFIVSFRRIAFSW